MKSFNSVNLIEDKIKIIRANIVLLEKQLEKEYNNSIKTKLHKEKLELERLRNTNPEFFI